MAKQKKTEGEKKGFASVKYKLKCKNEKQKEYSRAIKNSQIIIAKGPAGTGKSHVALGTALDLLRDSDTPFKKLVIMAAPVQTDLEIGYLKGGLDTKLEPHAASYLYLLAEMLGDNGKEKVDKLIEEGYIEILCVSFARGINLNDCICICGECQQYSKESFLTLISRPTETGKMIFEGDLNQTDNKNIRRGKEISGLQHAWNVLQDVPGISFVEFNKSEIVRNPLITRILELWDPDIYGG